MLVEDCCQALLAEILSPLSKSGGYGIEIGCGTFAFYCEIFDRLGLRSIAIEPLPVNNLRQICRYRNIPLVEACIAEYDGLIDLYIGNYLGDENLNLSSTRSNWWGATSTIKKVESMTLKSLIDKFMMSKIICLKIDIEGAEYSVLNQLCNLSETLLPKVLMFEYGGGGTFESQQGGWAEEFLQDTLNIISLLVKLGYTQAIKIDSEQGSSEKIIDLKNDLLVYHDIFEPQNIYGNIIAIYDNNVSKNTIQDICNRYRDNSLKAPSLNIKESLQKRVYTKIRQIIFKIISSQ